MAPSPQQWLRNLNHIAQTVADHLQLLLASPSMPQHLQYKASCTYMSLSLWAWRTSFPVLYQSMLLEPQPAKPGPPSSWGELGEQPTHPSPLRSQQLVTGSLKINHRCGGPACEAHQCCPIGSPRLQRTQSSRTEKK